MRTQSLKTIAIYAFIYSAGAFADQPVSAPTPTTLTITGGTVQFLAVGKPSAIKIRGKGTTLTGAIQVSDKAIAGDLIFSLNSLDTGIELRDHHMKEKYLETAKYPDAKLTVTKLALPSTWASWAASDSMSADGIAFEGTLSLHGVTKPVKGTTNIKKTGATASAHAEFDIAISDYSIDIPSYLGIKVADQVHVEVDANGATK